MDEDREMELLTAANKGELGRVEALLRDGVDPNCQGVDGWTPMHEAAAGNHVAVARALLAAGAHVNIRDNEGQTPLHVAAKYGPRGGGGSGRYEL